MVDDGAAPGAVSQFKRLVGAAFPKARFSGQGPAPWAVVAVFAKVQCYKGRILVPKALIRRTVRRVKGCGRVVALLFGSPYVAKDLPKSWSVLTTYSDAPDSLAAGVGALASRSLRE